MTIRFFMMLKREQIGQLIMSIAGIGALVSNFYKNLIYESSSLYYSYAKGPTV